MYTGGFAATNGYAFRGPDGWIIVDAPEGIAAWLAERDMVAAALLLTHAHFDHVADAAAVVASAGGRCPVWAWETSTPESRLEPLVAFWMGSALTVPPYPVDEPLKDRADRLIAPAGLPLRWAHVPGHSADSVIFIDEQAGRVFAGDTLMEGSIGRCDFPGGNEAQLLAGIRREILSLPDGMEICSGHGGLTTVGDERRGNPFLR